MNNRKRKKESARRRLEYGRRAGLHKLLDLVLDINGVGRRDRETTGELPTAFFDFSGHTAAVHIRVHSRGWSSGHDCDYYEDVWEHQDIDKAVNRLACLNDELLGGDRRVCGNMSGTGSHRD